MCEWVPHDRPLTGKLRNAVERRLLAYSVEKLQIGRDVILLQSEHTRINPNLTCVQADARARKGASAASWCPPASPSRGRL
jgi:hypothetical protein